jgi:hypothetical protein
MHSETGLMEWPIRCVPQLEIDQCENQELLAANHRHTPNDMPARHNARQTSNGVFTPL